MDTSFKLAPLGHSVSPAAPLRERAVTTRVQPLEQTDHSATLPDNKPFVAQVVTARLSGTEFPDASAEIVPAERTLRPYDVPMLPSDAAHEDAAPDYSAPQADTTPVAAAPPDPLAV